jgi:hypothetical protein
MYQLYNYIYVHFWRKKITKQDLWELSENCFSFPELLRLVPVYSDAGEIWVKQRN